MATLGLKEMGKFLWEGREKVLPSWLSQFTFASFLGLDAMPLSLKNLLLSALIFYTFSGNPFNCVLPVTLTLLFSVRNVRSTDFGEISVLFWAL